METTQHRRKRRATSSSSPLPRAAPHMRQVRKMNSCTVPQAANQFSSHRHEPGTVKTRVHANSCYRATPTYILGVDVKELRVVRHGPHGRPVWGVGSRWSRNPAPIALKRIVWAMQRCNHGNLEMSLSTLVFIIISGPSNATPTKTGQCSMAAALVQKMERPQ
jgi:hypothetical protein